MQIGGNSSPYNSKVERITAEMPNISFWISSKNPYMGFGESQPYYCKAEISIWWKKNAQNQIVPGIIKPIIIVDGFDPTGDRDNRDVYDLFEYYNEFNQKVNFAEELRALGFDIIIMDMPGYTKDFPITLNDPTSTRAYPKPLFDDFAPSNLKGVIYGGGDFQQRNASALEFLIDYCNQELQNNNSTEKIVMIGPSMGGQVTRYALRDMEIRGLNHNCRLWVAFDSQHQGSYAPLGLQYSANKLGSEDNEAAFFKSTFLDCPEAKQSLLHHYTSNSETVSPAPGFFNDYFNLVNTPSFGFPQAAGLRRIAMINGSDLGVPQTFGVACQLATKLEAKYRPRKLLASILYSPLALIFSPFQTHRTYLAPATGECTVFKLSNDIGSDQTQKIYAPSWCNTSLDMVQGGHVPVYKIYSEEINGQRPKKWYKNYIKLFVDDYMRSQTQQLTYSTLGIGLGSMPASPARKWDENFRIDKFNQPTDVTCPETKESPFDMYWAPDVNTRHDSLLLGHVIRLRKEIIDKQEWQKTQLQRQVTIQSTTTSLCNGQNGIFSLGHSLPGMTYNWTTNNPSLQVTAGQGTSSVVIQNNGSSNGYYQINVQASSPCYLINGSYTIHIGGYSSSDYPISGPSSACKNSYAYFNTVELPGAINYQWTWTSNLTYVSGQGTRFLTVNTGSSTGMAAVTVRVANNCDAGGSPAVKTFFINNCGFRFFVSPNPTNGNIVVSTTVDQKQSVKEINRTKIYQLRIIDQLGNVMKQYRYPGGITNANINTSFLAAGVYVIHAYNGDTWGTTKFVKQ